MEMMRAIIAGGAAMMAISAAAAPAALPSAEKARTEVQAALNESAAAWSAGNLDRFMTCYENAPTTTYLSGNHFVHGYDAIRAMYAERFGGGSKAAMGDLTLEIVDFRLLGTDFAYVIGRYHLHRAAEAGGDASGPTSLVFRRTPQGWRIIADHS
jgi:uncharacterized protein (TIGR02246 family)